MSEHVVAVFGAGTMGHGIAQVLAQGGYAVRLFDLDGALLEAAQGKVRKNLEGAVKRGKLEAEAVEQIMGRLVLCPDLDAALGETTMAIEALGLQCFPEAGLMGERGGSTYSARRHYFPIAPSSNKLTKLRLVPGMTSPATATYGRRCSRGRRPRTPGGNLWWCGVYTLINRKTRRPQRIPEDVIALYSV